jgi:hypothetical protein
MKLYRGFNDSDVGLTVMVNLESEDFELIQLAWWT